MTNKTVVRALELGYGTCSVVTGESTEGFIIRTFPSIPVSVNHGTQNLSGDILSHRKTVIVPVGHNNYEVGEDVQASADPRSTRVLNTESYIDSERYNALFKGALKMIPEDEIDLLVCGLPVSVMPRANELKKLVEGKHDLGDGREVTVKSSWVIAQPLGGLLAYARDGGQERFNEMRSENLLVVDPGYLTVDWLVTRGLMSNENRSGDFEGGMSKILDKVADAALKVFSADERFKRIKEVNVELIDQAFVSGKLKLFGHKMDFPIHKGDDKTPSFDFTDAINSVAENAISALINKVGDAQDLDRILVVGGPAKLYVHSLQQAFPNHTIQVLNDSLRANVIGFQEGGKQRMRAIEKKKALAK
ncbi:MULTISPECIES: PRTRC system protein D [unclassified Pseudoalteromonas]|uniref:PRTRC system protein D n=1 Tax=unclassified Pseudoalteromonas TaxID=194690 RepID=UPI0004662D91|nr:MULTISPECIES: PRTRC system protein D [unclassified Pseudoalteromonas]